MGEDQAIDEGYDFIEKLLKEKGFRIPSPDEMPPPDPEIEALVMAHRRRPRRQWVSAAEASRMLEVSVMAVHRMLKRGDVFETRQLPGMRVQILLSSVEEVMRKSRGR